MSSYNFDTFLMLEHSCTCTSSLILYNVVKLIHWKLKINKRSAFYAIRYDIFHSKEIYGGGGGDVEIRKRSHIVPIYITNSNNNI